MNDEEPFAQAFSAESPVTAIRGMTAEQRENYSRWLDDIAARSEAAVLLRAAAFVVVPDSISAQNCVAILKERAARRMTRRLQPQIETAREEDLDDLLRMKLAAARKVRE